MPAKRSLTVITLTLLAFTSCKKDELPVSPPDKGDVITASVEMTPSYKYQLYFDLGTNSLKGQNPKTDWDLGFACGADENHVVLNTSKMMFAAAITDRTFEEITDTSGYGVAKKTDDPNGDPALTAFAQGDLFIVNKGVSETGTQLGFFKIRILSVDISKFEVRIAKLDGSQEALVNIPKHPDYNYTFLNWNNSPEIVSIEPPKSDWDLQFTQYTHLFYEPEYTPYLVTGCLLNSSNTNAILVSDRSFESVDLAYAQGLLLSPDRNEIGYNWKEFDGTQYTVDSELTYVIRDNEGYFYKLRFIDFYNNQGEKGYPRFEFQQL